MNVQWSFRLPLLSLALALSVWLPACTPNASKPLPKGFPVIKPFAIDRAGSTVSAEFELPDSVENGVLRPVFVGFRAIEAPTKVGTSEFKASVDRTDYMRREPMPVRLRVWRLENGQRVPVVLQKRHRDMQADRTWYEPHPDDAFTTHGVVDADTEELIVIGQDDPNKVYFEHQFARIIPPTPGRYALEAESLQNHPNLHSLRFELLVSHHAQHGIR